MTLRLRRILPCFWVFLSLACSSGSSIQTDRSIREERASSAQSEPVVVKATVRINDGTALANRSFHLVTISRNDTGEMKRVEQLYAITSKTDANGNLSFQLPREKISGVAEFSLGLTYSNSGPLAVRRKDAKEILTFKADEKTKSIDLGAVIVPLG